MRVRSELYVDAARVSGLSDMRIIGRHILSVVRAPIIIQTAIIAGIAIGIQSGLEFLGLGDMSVPTWGSMLNDGFANIYQAPLLMLWPSLAIATTCIALTLLANAMRDVLERTVTVRRRRRRAVATATGSIAAVTTSLSTSGADAAASRTRPSSRSSTAAPIVHEDDAFTADKPQEVVLSIRDLRVAYQQTEGTDIEVVHGVSLDIRKGEIHGLIGESGSGKTQTAFAVLGLLPRGGHVVGRLDRLRGHRARGRIGARLRRHPRQAHRIHPAGADVEPRSVVHDRAPARRAAAQDAGPEQEGGDRARRSRCSSGSASRTRSAPSTAYPFEVSGGMAQRVLIAGAVSTDPDLIIADEPTTALDVTVQAEVLDLLRDLQRERHMAMLLVTHNFGDRRRPLRSGHRHAAGSVRRAGPGPHDPRRPVAPVHPVPAGRDPRRGSRPTAAGLRRRRIRRSEVMSTLLKVTDLEVAYPGKGFRAKPFQALKGVSLDIKPGETVGPRGRVGLGQDHPRPRRARASRRSPAGRSPTTTRRSAT